MRKTKSARILAVLTALVMSFIMMPQLYEPALAGSGDPATTFSMKALEKDCNTDNAATLWYGTYDNAPLAWRVIGYDGSGIAAGDYEVSLISGKKLASCKPFSYNSCKYSESKVKEWMDGYANGDSLTGGEKAAIASRVLDEIDGNAVTDAKMWALSYTEHGNLAASLRTYIKEDENKDQGWWLRSTDKSAWSSDGNYLVYFSRGEGVATTGYSNASDSYNWYVRPGVNLKFRSVAFTSAINGGKDSGAPGENALKEVGNAAGNEWKLTVKYGHDSFGIHDVRAAGEKTLELGYTGSPVGDNEYVSAVITDKKDNIKYYGRLQQVKRIGSEYQASGTVRINLDGKLTDSDKLYVFNEQVNEGTNTDYSSELIEVAVPSVHNVVFTDEEGNILKETEVFDGQAAEAPDTAREGYVFKGWSKDFSNVKQNLVVVGRWEKSQAPADEAAEEAAKKAAAEKAAAEKAAAEKAAAEKEAAELAEWNGVLNKKLPVAKNVKVKAAKKNVTVSWTKANATNLKKFDKVEIQVCTDKKFKKANTIRKTAKKTKKSLTVKKLKSKKTYYVRVRNVKGSGTAKQVSKWSKVKKVKIK